jgi:hypothetical protein
MNYVEEYQSCPAVSVKNDMSLYIPHVFVNYTRADIADVFESLRFGKVRHIDLVPKHESHHKPYNAAYVHFEQWFNTHEVANFQERVMNPNKEARVVYDDPWYWIVLENNTRKRTSGNRKLRIILDDFKGSKHDAKVTGDSDDAQAQTEFLAEIELLEEECDHIISIDGRYVEALENINQDLQNENIRLRAWLDKYISCENSCAMPAMPAREPSPM